MKNFRKDRLVNTVVTETPSSEDDLLLGASASPTTSGETGVKMRLEQLDFNYDAMEDGDNDMPVPVLDVSNNYVGLVNQAMTCYLNSLLQALYMTPEFRNALYNWEFDGVNETRSIPFQLQKLFLNLQVSDLQNSCRGPQNCFICSSTFLIYFNLSNEPEAILSTF